MPRGIMIARRLVSTSIERVFYPITAPRVCELAHRFDTNFTCHHHTHVQDRRQPLVGCMRTSAAGVLVSLIY